MSDINVAVELKATFSLLSEFRDTFSNLVSSSDIKIWCGNGIFSAHKLILASLSNFLANIFHTLPDEDTILIIPDIDNKRLESLLKILYGVDEKYEMDGDLIKVFDLLGIDISQYVDLVQPTQMYGMKQPSYPRLDRLLSLELDEELLTFEDLETILPSSRTILPSSTTIINIETRNSTEVKKIEAEGILADNSVPVMFDQCSVCKRSCDTEILVKYHKLIHSALFKEQQAQGICAVCNKKVKHDYIFQHLREVHFLGLSSKYTCAQCGKNFVRKEKYEGHLSQVHGAPMRYICNICGKLFSINSDLYKHRSQVHFAKAEIPCPTCNKLFKTKERLKRHQQLHADIKPWKCETCSKIFSRKDKLKEHLKSVHLAEKTVHITDTDQYVLTDQHKNVFVKS